MEKKVFEAKLIARGPKGAWTFLHIPFKVEEVFGTKARVSVAGSVNGFPFRNSIMPEGDGTHAMMFGKDMQAGAKAKAGETVQVVMWRDEEKRVVTLPPEFKAALKKNGQALAVFEGLAPSGKKDYADWIAGAKRAETKASRVVKAMELLAAGRKRVT